MEIRQVDHIVCAVPHLEEGIEAIANVLGVRPVFGGYHSTQGTKNAILNLSEGVYFEILAVDETNLAITKDRWMGVDLIDQPQITRWAMKSNNLAADCRILETYDSALALVEEGKRVMNDGSLLTWGLTMPLPSPIVEVMPFMIDWKDPTVHPTSNLDEACKLVSISIHHPDPQSIQTIYDKLNVNLQVAYSPISSIKIKVESPKGIVEI